MLSYQQRESCLTLNSIGTVEFLVEKTMDLFLDPSSKLAGQQLCMAGNTFGVSSIPITNYRQMNLLVGQLRPQNKYFSPSARENANAFFPQELLDEMLAIPEGIPVVPL